MTPLSGGFPSGANGRPAWDALKGCENRPMRANEIDRADVETLHEMRQELIAQERFGAGDPERKREIEGALQRKGEGVGVA